MSKFLTPLRVEEVTEDSWLLTEPLVYQSDVANRTITVPAGFQTDFASVPRLPFIFEVLGGEANKSAVVHDWNYSEIPHSMDRKTADAILKEAAIASGLPRWKAWMLWVGVRVGGASHWVERGDTVSP